MNFLKQSAEKQYHNVDSFIENLLEKSIIISLEYNSTSVNDRPFFFIKIDNDVIFNEAREDGTHKLDLKVQLSTHESHEIEFGMHGKKPNDTVIDNDKIIKDTNIQLLGLYINNYSLLDDYDLFFQEFEYVLDNNCKQKPMTGFWANATLKLKFSTPFDKWYNTKSKKNTLISESLKYRSTNNIEQLVDELKEVVKKLENYEFS